MISKKKQQAESYFFSQSTMWQQRAVKTRVICQQLTLTLDEVCFLGYEIDVFFCVKCFVVFRI